MSTSGTYNFISPQVREIIDEAYERVGILATNITEQKIVTAIRSLNFVLQEWVSKGNNLWTIRHGMIGLVPNQSAYKMVANGIDIKTAAIRTSTRLLGGSPVSSAGGSAANSFDGNPQTACSQLSPNGYISYNWGASQNVVSMVGIQSNVNSQYALEFERSNDGVNWVTALSLPAQDYVYGNLQWFVVPVPAPSNQFRVREVNSGSSTENWEDINYANWEDFVLPVVWETWGNVVPLNVQELYFDANLNDTVVTRLSESEYTSLPNKSQTGRPSSFWVDRQIEPVVYLWPTPTGQYNNLYFTYWKAIQDIGSMTDSAEIPVRFIEPLCSALAYKLAVKEGDQSRMQMLAALAEQAYKTSADEDRERVPLRIYGDYMQGWGSV